MSEKSKARQMKIKQREQKKFLQKVTSGVFILTGILRELFCVFYNFIALVMTYTCINVVQLIGYKFILYKLKIAEIAKGNNF